MKSLSRWLLIFVSTVSPLVSFQVAAQPLGGSVSLTGGFTHVGLYSLFAGCEASSGPLNCAVPGARAASVGADGHFAAPQAFDPNNPSAYQLAEIGASARTSAEAYSFNGFGDRPSINDVSQGMQVSSSASFNDYLLLGAIRPNSMSLVFELTGGLALHPLFTSLSVGAEVQATYTVGAQSVTRLADGVFASVSPFAYGGVIVNQKRANGNAPAVTQTFLDSDPSSSFTHTSTDLPSGATRVEIVLGPDFFANPDNSAVLLGMSMLTFARSPVFFFDSGLPFDSNLHDIQASADFNSTFKFITLTALDANGNDITADAIQGFASMSAVPLPAPAGFMLLGVGVLVALKRSRQPASVPV